MRLQKCACCLKAPNWFRFANASQGNTEPPPGLDGVPASLEAVADASAAAASGRAMEELQRGQTAGTSIDSLPTMPMEDSQAAAESEVVAENDRPARAIAKPVMDGPDSPE